MEQMKVVHLDAPSLSALRGRIATPKYDRTALNPRILHIGVGGFHRAHMACYTDELLCAQHTDWSTHGMGLTPADGHMAQVLHNQDGLYTLIARRGETEDARVIGSITKYFHVPDNAGDLCRTAAIADYRIISLTVTEKGYCFTGDDRHLDSAHPDIAHDLANPQSPRTAVGFLFRVAQLRIASNRALPTFLSCDNVPHNGSTLRNLMLQYSQEVDPEVAAVLADEGRFPNCMVDRITPGTSDSDRDYVRNRWAIEDAWPVVCEDFRQWYIEDCFAAGRPDWDIVGAEFISDVTPFERMKMWLLNGAHSAMAYLSYLLGYRRVDLAMADPDVLEFVRRYMAEIEPAVGSVPGVNLREYQATLVERFSNPAVADQILRLCEDGSTKIANVMLAPIADLAKSGRPFTHAALAIAAWARFLRGRDEDGQHIEIRDPNARRLTELANQCEHDVDPFLAFTPVFPPRLRANTAFSGGVKDWYVMIRKNDMRAALRSLLARN